LAGAATHERLAHWRAEQIIAFVPRIDDLRRTVRAPEGSAEEAWLDGTRPFDPAAWRRSDNARRAASLRTSARP
jgi:hypothetical protein